MALAKAAVTMFPKAALTMGPPSEKDDTSVAELLAEDEQ